MKQIISILGNVLLSIFLVMSGSTPVPGTSPAPVSVAENSPALSAAQTANSIEFSGADPSVKPYNSYVEVPFASALNQSGGALTIEAWVKPFTTTGCQTLVGNDWTVSYWLGLCDGIIRFYPHGTGSAVDGSRAVPANTWTHVAVTYDGTQRRYYINGNFELESAALPGKVTPNADGQPLNIGADFNGGGYYFNGRMQEVRIWNIARTQAQIIEGMYQSLGGPLTGLVSEWRFDGNTADYASKLDGTALNSAVYSLDGALPRTLRLEQLAVTPTLDGVCDPTLEYANANQVLVGGATAYVMHTATDLWVCFTDLAAPAAGVTDNFAAVYGDFEYTRGYNSTSSRIYALELHTSGTIKRSSYYSTYSGWGIINEPDSAWAGAISGEGARQAEFRIASSFIGGWNRVIGLSLAQHGVLTTGDSIFWPARATKNAFGLWGTGILYGPTRNFTFTGQVLYQSQVAGVSTPVPGQVVQLFGTQPSGSEVLVGREESNLDGSFSISSSDSYNDHTLRLDAGSLPRGTVTGPSIVFTGSPAGTYPGNILNIHDPSPTRPQNSSGPYFLIIAKDSMTYTLRTFVDYKTRLGFDVEVVTVEWIAAHMSGADIGEKVRNLEIARRTAKGARFGYVLLIGSNSTIPIRRFTIFAENQAECQGDVGEPTDWYYADLTDNFDSNGNGCWADGIWSDPARRAGYTPDSGISFIPTVSTGRLPFESGDLLRTYLNTAMAFEQTSPAYKSKALLAGSMYSIQGRCWYPKNSNGSWTTDSKYCAGVSGDSTDSSYLMEAINNHILLPNGFTSTRMYENEHPATGYSPAHFISPTPVTETNVMDALTNNDYGVVQLAGHGNYTIIARVVWKTDANLTHAPESPDNNDPVYTEEVQGDHLVLLEHLSARTANRYPGLYVTASCLTIQFQQENSLGSFFLTNRYAIGYLGGLGLEDGVWNWRDYRGNSQGTNADFSYMFTNQVIARGQRLGDAFWNSMQHYIANGNTDYNGMTEEFYGDPTLSYWGNPGQQSLNAPWAMQRSEPLGSSSTNLTGPSIGSLRWTYTGTAPVTSGLKPSPVASSTGEVLVADGTHLDVLVDGTAYQRLALDQTAYGSPAIAADGTAYVLDTAGGLYAFRYSAVQLDTCFRSGCSGGGTFATPSRSRRWKVALGGEPLGSPVIGSDGYIFVVRKSGTNSSVAAIRPDGTILGQQAVSGYTTGGLAVSTDRKVFAATQDGRILSIDFFSGFITPSISAQTNAYYAGNAYSTPPTIHDGWVYVGMSDGGIAKTELDFGSTTSSTLDSAITAGPAFDLNGALLVGTQNGTLYSLDPKDFSSNWTISLGSAITGIPAASSNGIYVVAGSLLHAYDPATGNTLWNMSMGTSVSGSTAVGYGRELYVQLSNGQVKAVSEGWLRTPWAMSVSSTIVAASTTPIMRILWSYSPPAPPAPTEGAESTSQAAAAIVLPEQYLLQRSDNGADWTDVGIIDAGNDPTALLTYDDADIQPGHLYAYRLQALDPTGQGLDSDFLTAYAQPSLPDLPVTPKLMSVTAPSSTSLLVKFSPESTGPASFRIERGPAGSGPFTAVATVNSAAGNMFTDQNLDPSTRYYYRVIAVNDTGESAGSNVLSGKTRSNSLAAPTHVHATAGPNNTVTVTWDPGATGLTAVIEASGFGVAGFDPVGTAGAETGSFTYDAGSPSSYAYRVKFVKDPDESPYTEADSRVSTGLFDTWMVQNKIYLPLLQR